MIRKVGKQGQVMVLTVLALGGTILGATTIAGLLTLYQIRQTSDLGNSAKAIFAADAGLEWSFYNLFCDTSDPGCPVPPLDKFSNGATVTVTCYDAAGTALDDCLGDEVKTIRSVGQAGAASRAFEVKF